MISMQETLLRLFLGAVIGGIVGFEREVHGRAAGFRTQLIVCVASVLIMITSENYYFYMDNTSLNAQRSLIFRIDPARIAAGALIGIGFLGAGVIVKSGFAIRGLTTAASIWIVSAIGLAIGAGLYFEGLITTAITVTALVVLRKIERNISIQLYKTIIVSTPITEKIEEQVNSILSNHGINIDSVDYEKNQSQQEYIYHYNISTRNKSAIIEVFRKLGELESIKNLKISSRDLGDLKDKAAD